MQLKGDNREKLLDGVDKLNNQNNQVDRIRNVAIDTHGQVLDTNRELREQRDIILDADRKVVATDDQTNKTRGLVNQMTRKEYWYKFLLFATIVLLFLGDLAALILKIA